MAKTWIPSNTLPRLLWRRARLWLSWKIICPLFGHSERPVDRLQTRIGCGRCFKMPTRDMTDADLKKRVSR